MAEHTAGRETTAYDYSQWRETRYAAQLVDNGGELFAFRVTCTTCEWAVRRSYRTTADAVRRHHTRRTGHDVVVEHDGFPSE